MFLFRFFPSIFTSENNLCDFLLSFLVEAALPTWGLLLTGKNLLLGELILYELTSTDTGGRNENGRIPPFEKVSSHLN